MASDQKTQVRGGTGVFTGTPLYVWISNQLGNTGVLTGFDPRQTNTTARPFNPNIDKYKPTNVDRRAGGELRAGRHRQRLQVPAGLAQQHRASIAGCPGASSAPTEFIYNKDVNGIYYINANLPAAQTAFAGVDNRPRWTGRRAPRRRPAPCVTRLNNAAGNQVTGAYRA